MDLRRPRARDWLLGVAGAALIASLFLEWYDAQPACPQPPCPSVGRTGWDAFAVNDVVLVLVGSVAVGALVATVTQRTTPVPVTLTALAGLLGALAAVLVAVRLVWPPGSAGSEPTRLAGPWIALALAVGQLAASVAANRDERQRAAPGEGQAGAATVRRRPAPPEPATEGG